MLATKEITGCGRRVSDSQVLLPRLGFGGASIGNLYSASSDHEAFSVLDAALESGITYYDTAPHYGHGLSEVRLGQWLKRVRRKDIQISTKVGRILKPVSPGEEPNYGFVDPLPFKQVFDYTYDGVMRSFDESCERLRVEHVDILYMHDIGTRTHGPESFDMFKTAMGEGFRAMHDLKQAGRVGAIGLGVNEWEVCDDALNAIEPDVFMVAGRFTLLENSTALAFLERCKSRQVSIVAASPFNSGLMATEPSTKSNYDYGQVPEGILIRAQHIFDICINHGVSTQALALQFPLLHPAVVSVVAGMSRPERVTQALDWMEEDIDLSVLTVLIKAGLADARLLSSLEVE